MKLPCPDCNGLEGYADDKDMWQLCYTCNDGEVNRCVSAATFPEQWKKKNGYDRLLEIQSDAKKCREDTRRLAHLNPKHADSYAIQLSNVLQQLNQEADNLKLY